MGSLVEDLEDCVMALEEANSDAVRAKVEAFKKMVFKMLNGKQKTVDTDEVEESDYAYVVKTPHNRSGSKPVNKYKTKKMLAGPGPGDRDSEDVLDIPHGKNKSGHIPVDPKSVKILLKGKSRASAGKATPTAKLRVEDQFRLDHKNSVLESLELTFGVK